MARLRAERARKCQRLLTLYLIRKVRAGGGVLDKGQRRVDLERLGDVLGTFGSTDIGSKHGPGEAANNGHRVKVSAAADTLPK